MSLLRFLGIGGARERETRGETETVRRIAERLERLPPDDARRLAAFAFVLARVAHADLRIEDSEIEQMERIVREEAGLAEPEAALVVQIAKSQATLLGGTENYVVTREYRNRASREQRAALLRCLFAVAAADGRIRGDESTEILKIAEELGFTRAEALAVRAEFREHLSELQH